MKIFFKSQKVAASDCILLVGESRDIPNEIGVEILHCNQLESERTSAVRIRFWRRVQLFLDAGEAIFHEIVQGSCGLTSIDDLRRIDAQHSIRWL